MARSYKGEASWRTMRLASTHSAGELLAAGAARAAAQLGRAHQGNIPPAAIEDTITRFGEWLRASCDAASQPTPANEDEDAC